MYRASELGYGYEPHDHISSAVQHVRQLLGTGVQWEVYPGWCSRVVPGRGNTGYYPAVDIEAYLWNIERLMVHTAV